MYELLDCNGDLRLGVAELVGRIEDIVVVAEGMTMMLSVGYALELLKGMVDRELRLGGRYPQVALRDTGRQIHHSQDINAR